MAHASGVGNSGRGEANPLLGTRVGRRGLERNLRKADEKIAKAKRTEREKDSKTLESSDESMQRIVVEGRRSEIQSSNERYNWRLTELQTANERFAECVGKRSGRGMSMQSL